MSNMERECQNDNNSKNKLRAIDKIDQDISQAYFGCKVGHSV